MNIPEIAIQNMLREKYGLRFILDEKRSNRCIIYRQVQTGSFHARRGERAIIGVGDYLRSFKIAESPIERRLFADAYMPEELRSKMIPQKKIGRYRADFLIDKTVIECDGKEFHREEKKDIDRDYYMLHRGYNVLRFSGSEVVNYPADVVKIIETVIQLTGEEG